MNEMTKPAATIKGEEHWTTKDGSAKLFMFEKCAGDPKQTAGTILFVHGSSMAAQPTFDLQVPGRPDSSVMDFFARQNFDCWGVDMEGYGRSTKDRDNNAPIPQGAEDCFAAATYINKLRGKRPLLVYGIAPGAVCTPWWGPGKSRRRWPSARRNCRDFLPKTAGQSTRRSSIRSSIAI